MNKKIILPLYLIALAALSLLVVGCQQSSEIPLSVTEVTQVAGEEVVVTRIVLQTAQAPVTPAAAEDGAPVELDLAMRGQIAHLDPQRASDPNALDLIENLFAGLTRYNHETDEIEPELALEWSISEDGRTWTFKLRDDIFWVRPVSPSNLPQNILSRQESTEVRAIRQVVAGDIVYAIRRVCDPRVVTPDAFVLFIIEGCRQVNQLAQPTPADLENIRATAVDNSTLQITLTKPASYFATIASLPFLKPVPPELVEEREQNWTAPEHLYTSGPFIRSHKSIAGTLTVLERNPFWPHAFQIDRVNIYHLESAIDIYELWRERSLDISPVPASERTTILRQQSAKAELIPTQAVFYLGYNFNSSVFRMPEARRAFSAAIDRERLIREVYGGRGKVMRHFTPPGVVGAPPLDEVGLGYDPDFARQQMAASPLGSCRAMPPIVYMVSASDTALHQAQLIREMWMDELGCQEDQIIIEQVPFGVLMANTRRDAGNARPDVWDLGWSSFYPDAHNWLSDVLHCTDSENRQNRPCAEVDDWIRRASVAYDAAQRRQLYRQIEQAFFGREGITPIAPLYVQAEYQLRHTWVHYPPALFGGHRYDAFRIDAPVKELERLR